MSPRVQKRVRIILSAMTLLTLAPLIAAFAIGGWRAIPRERCQWLDHQFCSDYGHWYKGFAAILLVMLFIALRLINRRPQNREEDVPEDPDRQSR